jgi:hypothetical protein
VFGVASVLAFLAIVSSVPLLSFLSLVYLLEGGRRVATTGRLRDGFVGVRKAARLGSIVLGTWLMTLPLMLLSDFWYSSYLIDPQSRSTRNMRFTLVVLTTLVVLHVVWAWFRGGRLRSFLWPAPLKLVRRIRAGGMLRHARDTVWDFAIGLRLPYYFWLGMRGFVGGAIWLFPPVLLLAAAFYVKPAPAVFLGLLGGGLLAVVILYLPFLQVNFAIENRFSAMFEVRKVRAMFQRAPIAFWFSLFITLLFSLPLYLLKLELTPREAAWLPGLAFAAFIAPARLLTGWAVARARRRETPRFFLFRWLAWCGEVPVVLLYAFIVHLTRYVEWYGSASLFEQHAFLLPIPFLGL